MNDRFFAFGCSFTNYYWPTWADILGKEFSTFYNYGRSGAGNMYILNSFIEAHEKYNFQENDTIGICFTGVTREDRYIDDWLTVGNIFDTNSYSKDFVEKYVTVRGCYIRDLAAMTAIDLILKNLSCKYFYLSMIDYRQPFERYYNYEIYDKKKDEVADVLAHYSTVLSKIKPSYEEVIFEYDWQKKVSDRKDVHPSPLEHLMYLQKVLPEYKVTEKVTDWVKGINKINLAPPYDYSWKNSKNSQRL